MFEIYDRKEHAAVGKPYGSRRRARQRRDVLDSLYGAYRYDVRPLAKPQTEEDDRVTH